MTRSVTHRLVTVRFFWVFIICGIYIILLSGFLPEYLAYERMRSESLIADDVSLLDVKVDRDLRIPFIEHRKQIAGAWPFVVADILALTYVLARLIHPLGRPRKLGHRLFLLLMILAFGGPLAQRIFSF